MSTSLISGLASGLDWRSMIDELIAIDHKRADVIEDRKDEYTAKLEAWQSFNTGLLAFKTSAEGLTDPADFHLYTSSMSSSSTDYGADDLLSVSTDATAAPGTYTVTVKSLAQAQKLSSNPFTSQTAELGSSYAGDIIINGKTLAILATNSLGDIAYNINALNTGINPSGVTASIINYGANDYRLVLTSDDTGADGISLLNGSAANLLQKFGWKDKETAVIKNSITNGAQSDLFTAPNVAIKTLLGLSTGESGNVTVGDTAAITIDLSTMSLNEIKVAINDAGPSGVIASVISETVDGTTYYRLQIEGTETISDPNETNILNTLGVLHNNSAEITAANTEISGNSMTSDGAYITPDTLLVDIDGYISLDAGNDKITFGGTDTGGVGVAHDFVIASSTTVQDLLDAIEDDTNGYAASTGDIVAYVTSDGRIRVDDVVASGFLNVQLTDAITTGELEFVDANAAFGDASARSRQVVAGGNSLVEIDGVEVTDSSNIIDDVIAGVTLDLASAGDGDTTVTLDIERDIATIKTNIQDFTAIYNEIMTYINVQFSYDEASAATGGILFGDATLRSVKSDMTTLLTEQIWGVDSNFSVLSMVGITVDNDLILSIDDDALTGYLQTNFNDVMSLFAGQGSTSNSALTYIDHSRDTKADKYTVHVNRAATRGTETGNVDLSSPSVTETLAITQGTAAAEIEITTDLDTLDDIINEINTELDTEYTETLVGDEDLYSDSGSSIAITSETAWDSIYDSSMATLSFADSETISFSGTSRGGIAVSGSYEIDMALETPDTVQDLLSAIEEAFSSEVNATIDTSGRIVVTDKYMGASQLSVTSISHTGTESQGEFFGTADVTSAAGDGSQEGRYAMSITATNDGNNLVLRSDDYGSASFTLAQSESAGNYDHILYTATGNNTKSTEGTVYITETTTWSDISGASLVVGDEIEIAGYARDGTTPLAAGNYVIDSLDDPVSELLTAIENAFSAQGTTVDAFIRNGTVYVEDTDTGSSAIELTLTPVYDGGGSGLALGDFDQTTRREMELGIINGDVTGVNVAGTIGGESATGSGQVLTGEDGNTNTDGLLVKYSRSANDTDAGTITITLGVAELFYRTLYNITNPYEGYVSFKQDSLNNSIDSFETQIEQIEAQLDRKMEMMINSYVTMETAMSTLQSQSSWLSGQISASYSAWG